MEIEKKFRVVCLPEHLEDFEKKEIEQGYLCTSPVVRVRKSNDRYILTYKSDGAYLNFSAAGNDPQDVRVNEEVEVPLSREGYLHLREKADDHLISKTRYIIPLASGHTAELDIFHGRLEGLYFVEVEFSDEQDAKEFIPPDWFGENVSMDERYTNSFLSKCEGYEDLLRNYL